MQKIKLLHCSTNKHFFIPNRDILCKELKRSVLDKIFNNGATRKGVDCRK